MFPKALRRVERGKMKPVGAIWGDAVSEALARYLGGEGAPAKAWQCVAMFGRMAHQATLRDVYDAAEAREWNVEESDFRYPRPGLRAFGAFAGRRSAGEEASAGEPEAEEAPGDDDPFSDDEDVSGGSLAAAVRRDLITHQQQQLVELVVTALDREARRCIAASAHMTGVANLTAGSSGGGAASSGKSAADHAPSSKSSASAAALTQLSALLDRIGHCQLLRTRAMHAAAAAKLKAAVAEGDAEGVSEGAAPPRAPMSPAEVHFVRFVTKPQRAQLSQLALTLQAALRDATQQGDRARRIADMKQQFELMRQSVQAEVDEHCLYWDAGLRFGRIAQFVPDAKRVPEHPFPAGDDGDAARALWETWGVGERDGVFDGAAGDVDDDDDDSEVEATASAAAAAAAADAEDDVASDAASDAVMSSCMPLIFTQWSRARRLRVSRVLVADTSDFSEALEELASSTEFEWLLREGHTNTRKGPPARLDTSAPYKALGSAIVQQIKVQAQPAMRVLRAWRPTTAYARRLRVGATKACRW